MKQPIRILGICLVIIVASLAAQAQGPNSPPLVVRFSGTDTFSFFNDCTGETVVGNIAFAGVLTQTVTNPGGPLEENHFDSSCHGSRHGNRTDNAGCSIGLA